MLVGVYCKLKIVKIMKWIIEDNLSNFKFWSGARDTADRLNEEQFALVEDALEDAYPDGITATQINDLFWFESETIFEWAGIVEYPKWTMFKTHLGNERYVQIEDEQDEDKALDVFARYNIKSAVFEHDDEPVCMYDPLDISDFDYDEWMWEEDENDFLYAVWVPRDWAAACENDDRSGFTDEEEAEFDRFLADYNNELSDPEHYKYYWDTEHIEFKDEPDYGDACDCITLRIYNV
jgi:hypothetical protein